MAADSGSKPDALRRKKNMIGIVAIGLLLVLTSLALSGVLSITVWIVADIVVALVANIILKILGRQKQQ